MGANSLDRQHFFIGGEWVKPSSDRTFTLTDASTEETLATVPEGQNADIDRAVAAARSAFESSAWRDMAPADRAALLRRFDAALQKRKDDLALAVSRQNGMPMWLSSAFEAGIALSMVNFYADLIEAPQAQDRRGAQQGDDEADASQFRFAVHRCGGTIGCGDRRRHQGERGSAECDCTCHD